jgi:5-bromo-4-chloroindolyl phosphate hydrolysis protein
VTRLPTALAAVLALLVLSGLAVVGVRVVSDVHQMRFRLDQQQQGHGAMPELQRTQIAIARQQLEVTRQQLAIAREQLATSKHIEATADATLKEARRTRSLVAQVLELTRRIAVMVARIEREQYQPPAPASSPSR